MRSKREKKYEKEKKLVTPRRPDQEISFQDTIRKFLSALTDPVDIMD